MDNLSTRATTLCVKTRQLQGCNAMQLMSRGAEVLSAVNELVNIVAELATAYEQLNEEVLTWRQQNASQ